VKQYGTAHGINGCEDVYMSRLCRKWPEVGTNFLLVRMLVSRSLMSTQCRKCDTKYDTKYDHCMERDV
jgi:hypothetical protein